MKKPELVFAAFLAVASPCAAQSTLSRPESDGEPTEVRLRAALIDVDDVDDASQSFTANVFFEARWTDPRLEHHDATPIRMNLEDVWNPEIMLVNRQLVFPTMPEVVTVDSDGIVTYRQRVWGKFSQPLQLRDFPFDTQRFDIWLTSAQYRPDEVVLVQDDANRSLIAPEFSLPDWSIERFETTSRRYAIDSTMAGRSAFVVSIEAERKTGYYLLKIILPFILIVMMSWIVFWIDPEQTGTQIGMAATSMLTLIAYRFAVDQLIPRVSYLTRLDRFILIATVLVFLAMFEGVLTAWWNRHEKRHLALQVDRWGRMLSPFLLAGLILYAFVI